jgi:8-oxo-dGTP diphosphatase
MQIVQKAVIKKKDKYLILLRSTLTSFFPLYWDFPGGKLEPGENLITGIIREVKEETNFDIKPGKIIGEYEFDLIGKGENTHHFNIYSTETISGDLKLSKEHLDLKWATKEEILSLPHGPYFEQFFKNNP